MWHLKFSVFAFVHTTLHKYGSVYLKIYILHRTCTSHMNLTFTLAFYALKNISEGYFGKDELQIT